MTDAPTDSNKPTGAQASGIGFGFGGRLDGLRQLRTGEEIRSTDLIIVAFDGLRAVKDVCRWMVGKTVRGSRNYDGYGDEIFRPRERAPKGYSVKDWQTDWHAYKGGECIAQRLTKAEAVAACWKHFCSLLNH